VPETADALTIPSRHADFPDWHRGRRRYAVWAIDVDGPAARAAVARLQEHLGDFLLPGYRRQPHVTLHLCGFPGTIGQLADDYTAAQFSCHLQALAAARLPPFAIAVGGPDTFTSAAFLAIADGDGGIAHVRRALGGGGAAAGDAPYVPHLTVGLYRAALPVARVRQLLAALPNPQPFIFEVTRLTLMTYEAAAIAGPLARIGEFDLVEQRWRTLAAGACKPLSGESANGL